MSLKRKKKTALALNEEGQETERKIGRPLKQVDETLILALAKIHCTKEEIATIVGCSRDTLYERFSDSLQKGFDEGKRSLRRLQWEQAEKGNVSMLIWLGKQWLGQKESQGELPTQIIFNVQVNEIPVAEIEIKPQEKKDAS